MIAQLYKLTPRVFQLSVVLDHVPTLVEKKDLEDRLEDHALTNLVTDNRGSIYSCRELDRVGIIVVSENDVIPYSEIIID